MTTEQLVDTPHGPMQVHAYPYSDSRSTFIVESTGVELDREQCEDLFGYRLIEKPVRGSVAKNVKVQVEQLSLLNELVLDPGVPEEFRDMALPGAKLPKPSSRARKRKRTEKKPEA